MVCLAVVSCSDMTLSSIKIPPVQKCQLINSPRNTIPKMAVNTTSAERYMLPSQLLQYLNPWFINSWPLTAVQAIPAAINHSLPDSGMTGWQ